MSSPLRKFQLKMVRLDVRVSERMKAMVLTLSADQGCTSVSEYVRILIRVDAERRGIELPQEFPVKEVKV